MKEILKKSGLALFIGCFALFNGLFLLEDYNLKEEHVRQVLDENRASLLLEELGGTLDKSFDGPQGLLTALDQAFENANTAVLEKYGLSEEELTKLVELNQERFSVSSADSVFAGSDDVSEFKRKSIADYAGWMDGQETTDPEALKSNLRQVANNIKAYGIVNQFGFDRYKQKDLRYSLVKQASYGWVTDHPILILILTFGGCIAGALMYLLPGYKDELPGIKNNGIFRKALTSRGWLGMVVGIWLIGFYIVLYFFHEYLTPWIILTDPVSFWLKGSAGGQFFLYGFMYTLVILVMGVRMIIKYRYSKYQVLRTLSVMFFQTSFAFLIPEILLRLNQPYFDFKNIWPLDYDFFFDNELNTLIQNGGMGIFMLVWGLILIVIAVPVLVYFFGKRWYCSWVCGCGGLAETLGDPFRQLSDKSLKAWKIERYMIHGVLVFAVIMTAGVLYTYFSGAGNILGVNTYTVREVYGAWIGAAFAGVVGTGFYPFMGNRVWCRFGCPLAAYLGIVQRFKSRFRITTNGGQCISCGNCSTYCEMGIDVRAYAQKGQDIVRASCVGCGICSQVCPRGVLRLENR